MRGVTSDLRQRSLRKWSSLCLAWILLITSTTVSNGQRNLANIPDPDPEIERQSFQVVDGFEVNLFAGDPQIAKPIQMNFDEQGRLWIASSEVYPHLKPGQEATDKILVCEDTNGDGQVDTTTVFADGLLIPTGVVPGDGGCYVVNSTELIHLKDTDGDGRADQRRIILSGFGTEDTHHLLHTLRWGHDGQLYMNQSIYIHSHIETPYGVKHLNGGGIWRFRPETMQLDVLCEGFVNPWGHHFDEWGQSFATDGAYGEGINYVFPGSVFVTAPGAKRILRGLNPGSPKHCGLEILSGRHLPPEWQGSMVTNDFRANRVCRFVVSEDRSAYSSRQEVELIKTDHVAFRPIDVKMGPDGAIYIADWYNPIIQHGEVDFRDPRRDHVHGRIWRITAKDRPLLDHPDLIGAAVEQLLEYLAVPEEWVRLHAKLQLKQRGPTEVLPKLEAWLSSLDPGSDNYEKLRVEGLWVYQNLNVLNTTLLGQIAKSPDHRARAAALRVADQWSSMLPDGGMGLMTRGVRDEHPRVRLEAIRGLSTVGTQTAAVEAMKSLEQPMDDFLEFALWATMRDLRDRWLPAVQAGRLDFEGDVAKLSYALRAVEAPEVVKPILTLLRQGKVEPARRNGMLALAASLSNPQQLSSVIQLAKEQAGTSQAEFATLVLQIARASSDRRGIPSSGREAMVELLGSETRESVQAAVEVCGLWQVPEGVPEILKIAETTPDDSLYRAALKSLGQIGNATATQGLVGLREKIEDSSRQAILIGEISRVDLPAALGAVSEMLANADMETDLASILNPILSQQGAPAKLANAIKGKKMNSDAAKAAVRLVQGSPRPNDALLESLRNAGDLANAGWQWSAELSDALVAEVAERGDPKRGEAIYRRADSQCLNCHAIGGAGGKVGPDLVSIGASAPVDYLIESMLAPNAKVKEGYHSKVIQTESGELFTGVVVSNADGLWTLRQANDQLIRIPDEEVADMTDGRSLMPDGAADVFTRDELVDLVAFLSRLGKVGEYSLGNRQWIRSWNSLVWTPEANRRLNRTSYDIAASDDSDLTWARHYSEVAGTMPVVGLDEFVVRRGSDPATFLRFKIQVTTEGKVKLEFGDTAGLSLWIDGQPTPIGEQWEGDLGEGIHEFVLAINRNERREPLRIELVDASSNSATCQIVLDP